MDRSEHIEVTLTGLVYGGDAMGRLPDGRAVFVPFAMPGETVCVNIVEEKSHHALARIEEILVPSELRITPRCQHFGSCGGCHYQNMPYSAQLDAKTAILVDQLMRIGKISVVPVRQIVPSPLDWEYRNNIQFRTTPDGRLGFSRSRSNEIISINECYLPKLPLDEIWPLLNLEPGSGIQRVGLSLDDEDNIQIVLEGKTVNIPDITIEDMDVSVVHVTDNSSVVLAGSEYSWMKVRERVFRVSAGTFFQVNTPVAENLVEAVLSELFDEKHMTILELHCGAGLFSAFLAQIAERLVAIEISSSACNDFAYNLDEFDNVELYEAPAEIVIPSLVIKPDLVLVDPPRGGMLRSVLHGIISLASPKIVYISCDPATLARDARFLIEGGYALKKVTPFDMFPQTYHLESISVWEHV